MKYFSEIYKDAWRIITSCGLLWLVYVPTSVLDPLMRFLKTSPLGNLNYILFPFYFFIGLFAMGSFPYIIARSKSEETCTLRDAWKALRRSFLRFLAFFFIGGFILITPVILMLYVLYIDKYAIDTWQSVWKALSIKYLAMPVVFAIFNFSITGIVIHRLNVFKTLFNSILIIIDNPLLVYISSILFMIIRSIIQTILLTINGSSFSFQEVFITMKPYPNSYLLFIDQLLSIILSMYLSTVLVLIYLNATRRIQYPWIKDTNIV